jgi:hypothetical protein
VVHPAGEKWFFMKGVFEPDTRMLTIHTAQRSGPDSSFRILLEQDEHPRDSDRFFEIFEETTIPMEPVKRAEPAVMNSEEWVASFERVEPEPVTLHGGERPDWGLIEAQLERVGQLADEGRWEDAARALEAVSRLPDPNGYIVQSVAAGLESRRGSTPEATLWIRKQALSWWQSWAAGATSGGEGTARMMDVNRVQKMVNELMG